MLRAALFGACHWINNAYAVLAALIGIHLGVLLVWSGNLVAPVAAHAFYDFVAIEFLLRRFRHEQQVNVDSEGGESS